MAKKIIKQHNVSRLDIINSEASNAFRDIKGETIEIKGAAVCMEEAQDEDEEPTQIAYVYGVDGQVYGGNSATIIRSIDGLIDIMEDEPDKRYTVTVNGRQAKSGREFLSLLVGEVV